MCKTNNNSHMNFEKRKLEENTNKGIFDDLKEGGIKKGIMRRLN